MSAECSSIPIPDIRQGSMREPSPYYVPGAVRNGGMISPGLRVPGTHGRRKGNRGGQGESQAGQSIRGVGQRCKFSWGLEGP